jgi:hypothetical protein
MFPQAALSYNHEVFQKLMGRIPEPILEVLKLLGGNHVVLAGGAIRAIANDEEVKDFDLFCNSKLAANTVLSYLHGSWGCKVRLVPGVDASPAELEPDAAILSTSTKDLLRNLKEGTANLADEILLGSPEPSDSIYPSEGAPSWGFYREVVETSPGLFHGKPVQICTAAGGILHGLFVMRCFDLTVCQSLFYWDTDGRWATAEQVAKTTKPLFHKPRWNLVTSPLWRRDTPAKILRGDLTNFAGSLKLLENSLAHGNRLVERGYAWDATHLEKLKAEIEKAKVKKGGFDLPDGMLMSLRTPEGVRIFVSPHGDKEGLVDIGGEMAYVATISRAVALIHDGRVTLARSAIAGFSLENLGKIFDFAVKTKEARLASSGSWKGAYLERAYGGKLHIVSDVGEFMPKPEGFSCEFPLGENSKSLSNSHRFFRIL